MAKKMTRLEAFQEVFRDNDILIGAIEGNDTLIRKIRGYAETVHDSRHQSYVRHPLASIIMIVFFAVLCNANEWAEIEAFAREKEKWLRKHLDLPYGIPTDDTYRIVIGNIDAGHFFQLTTDLLVRTVGEMLRISGNGAEIHGKSVISVDGKVSCGSGRKTSAGGEVKAYQTLNVYSSDYGMCIGQKFIEEKTNEIPAAQEVLGLMNLKDTIVTADAMNCQKDTAAVIRRKGGDYALALKGNQPAFYKEVTGFFDGETLAGLRGKDGCYKKTIEPEHGGTAIREYYITEETGWYAEKGKWSGLRSFGMVHKTMKKADGSVLSEKRYYICSINADADEFERAVRGHWGVENGLHWQLDFTFRDDKNASMEKCGAKNLQIMKKIALSILRLVKDSYKMSMKRIRYKLSLNVENGIEELLALLDIDSVKDALESNGKSSGK